MVAENCSVTPKKIATTWRAGDTLPEISFVLPDGQLVSSFPTLQLRIARPDGTILTKAAVDLGGSRGKFTWETTDLQAGDQRAEIYRIDGSGKEFTTLPFIISVQPRVGD